MNAVSNIASITALLVLLSFMSNCSANLVSGEFLMVGNTNTYVSTDFVNIQNEMYNIINIEVTNMSTAQTFRVERANIGETTFDGFWVYFVASTNITASIKEWVMKSPMFVYQSRTFVPRDSTYKQASESDNNSDPSNEKSSSAPLYLQPNVLMGAGGFLLVVIVVFAVLIVRQKRQHSKKDNRIVLEMSDMTKNGNAKSSDNQSLNQPVWLRSIQQGTSNSILHMNKETDMAQQHIDSNYSRDQVGDWSYAFDDASSDTGSEISFNHKKRNLKQKYQKKNRRNSGSSQPLMAITERLEPSASQSSLTAIMETGLIDCLEVPEQSGRSVSPASSATSSIQKVWNSMKNMSKGKRLSVDLDEDNTWLASGANLSVFDSHADDDASSVNTASDCGTVVMPMAQPIQNHLPPRRRKSAKNLMEQSSEPTYVARKDLNKSVPLYHDVDIHDELF